MNIRIKQYRNILKNRILYPEFKIGRRSLCKKRQNRSSFGFEFM
jgi:hypothetical protein